jgi:hypothetical protein
MRRKIKKQWQGFYSSTVGIFILNSFNTIGADLDGIK